MSAEAFLDTNVLVYCFEQGEPEKQRTALQLVESALRQGTALISTQVVQEFLNLATRKFASDFAGDDLRAYLDGVLVPLCKVISRYGTLPNGAAGKRGNRIQFL